MRRSVPPKPVRAHHVPTAGALAMAPLPSSAATGAWARARATSRISPTAQLRQRGRASAVAPCGAVRAGMALPSRVLGGLGRAQACSTRSASVASGESGLLGEFASAACKCSARAWVARCAGVGRRDPPLPCSCRRPDSIRLNQADSSAAAGFGAAARATPLATTVASDERLARVIARAGALRAPSFAGTIIAGADRAPCAADGLRACAEGAVVSDIVALPGGASLSSILLR